jgi:ABC-type lipoprotein export system ATPase subunit
MRQEVQQRLAMAMSMADDPATVLCVEPFTSVERDGGEHLGKLLTRVMGDPDHALLVATGTAFVFAFRGQVGRSESKGMRDNGAAEGPT